MKRLIIVLLIIFATSSVGFAKMVESKFHHIGDSTMFGFLVPEPEGLQWSGTVRLNKGDLRKDFAFLSFVSHSHGVEIYVNGNQINDVADVLETDIGLEEGASSKFFEYIIRVPLEYLQLGLNTIDFVSRQMENGYDDSEFGKITIHFQ